MRLDTRYFYRTALNHKPITITGPGAWVGLSGWPSDQIEIKPFHLSPGRLSPAPVSAQAMDICSPQTTGQLSGEYMPWFSFGPAEELPGDQQSEDAGSLVFDTEALIEPLEILGNAVAMLQLSSDQVTGTGCRETMRCLARRLEYFDHAWNFEFESAQR